MRLPDMNVQTAGASALWSSVGLKRYELTNNLGNVLAIISDAAKVNDYPVVTNAQDYYPFGMVQPSRSYKRVAGVAYRFGFNGKENDNEVKGIEGSQQDYGMRIYDPRIAKFLSVDPITGDYPELTPYQFASNSPIWGVDLDGLELSKPLQNPDYKKFVFGEPPKPIDYSKLPAFIQPPKKVNLPTGPSIGPRGDCWGCAERMRAYEQAKEMNARVRLDPVAGTLAQSPLVQAAAMTVFPEAAVFMGGHKLTTERKRVTM